MHERVNQYLNIWLVFRHLIRRFYICINTSINNTLHDNNLLTSTKFIITMMSIIIEIYNLLLFWWTQHARSTLYKVDFFLDLICEHRKFLKYVWPPLIILYERIKRRKGNGKYSQFFVNVYSTCNVKKWNLKSLFILSPVGPNPDVVKIITFNYFALLGIASFWFSSGRNT